jgi:hypothetical protein
MNLTVADIDVYAKEEAVVISLSVLGMEESVCLPVEQAEELRVDFNSAVMEAEKNGRE